MKTDNISTKNEDKKHDNIAEAADTKPGIAVDIADDDKVTPAEVKQYTKELNNNPRNNEL